MSHLGNTVKTTQDPKLNSKRQVSQLGDKLERVDPDPEIDGIMANIKGTGKKYREMLSTLHDKTEAAARSSGPIRKSGAALIRCAGIADKVARDIATGPGAQGFFKETPTYQQDLNEALLVSSAAILYSADRIQALHTTSVSLDQVHLCPQEFGVCCLGCRVYSTRRTSVATTNLKNLDTPCPSPKALDLLLSILEPLFSSTLDSKSLNP